MERTVTVVLPVLPLLVYVASVNSAAARVSPEVSQEPDSDGHWISDNSSVAPDCDGLVDAAGASPAGSGEPDAAGLTVATDNCPNATNALQLDTNGDGDHVGEACDTRGYGVDVANELDDGAVRANADRRDTDDDRLIDGCDDDRVNHMDRCPLASAGKFARNADDRPDDSDGNGDAVVAENDKWLRPTEDGDRLRDWNGCPKENDDRDAIPDVDYEHSPLAESKNGLEDADGCPENDAADNGGSDAVDQFSGVVAATETGCPRAGGRAGCGPRWAGPRRGSCVGLGRGLPGGFRRQPRAVSRGRVSVRAPGLVGLRRGQRRGSGPGGCLSG